MTDEEIHAKVIELYYNDRVGFVEDIIFNRKKKYSIDVPQLKILKDLDNGKKNLAIKSGKGVGKTTVGSWIILHYLMTRPKCIITATAPSANQLNDVLWPEIKRWLTVMDTSDNPIGRVLAKNFKWTAENIYHKDYGDIWFAAARTATRDNPQSLAGRHSEYNLNFIDEASDVSDKAVEAMEGNYGTNETITILIGNPVNTSGSFYRIFNEKNPTYTCHTISCLDSRIATFDYVEKMAKRYGEESDIYKSQVLGEFPQTSTSSFIPYTLVRKCINAFFM